MIANTKYIDQMRTDLMLHCVNSENARATA